MTLTQHVANEINKNKTHISLSGIASYHLISGALTLSGTVTTSGFATTLYTGNGTTQSVVTGVDMATQWGNNTSEAFGGLVWAKSRSGATNNFLYDTIRGVTKEINSNTTDAEATLVNSLTAFNADGFSVGSDTGHNANLATYASWAFQTTHRITGVTNHGKAYTCHYNPFTGFTIVKYEGSGLAGHEIPHHLGRKLGLYIHKNLSAVSSWLTQYKDGSYLSLNLTNAETTASVSICSDVSVTVNTENTSTNQYILYGWANSYFDEANTLQGNYEVGIYQGSGAAGNKVTTRGKPAWVMIKRVNSTGDWVIQDNQRIDKDLLANSSAIENAVDRFDIYPDGFVLKSTDAGTNVSGGQYLYMVVYDNDSGSGKSKYQRATDTGTLNLNATIPFANGVDSNGTKNSILVKNETVSGLTLTEGKNYIYAKNDGTYGLSSVAPAYGNVNPASGDFFNVLENKWYTSAGIAITESRNYLNAVVYADQNGQPTYVEQLPKIEYKKDLEVDTLKVHSGFDLNQTWQDMTASRVIGTTYTNTTGKPIMVAVKSYVALNNGVYSLDMYVNNVLIYQHEANIAVAAAMYLSGVIIVPHGATYKIGETGFATWYELR